MAVPVDPEQVFTVSWFIDTDNHMWIYRGETLGWLRISDPSSGIISVSNGLTPLAGVGELGGPLTKTTIISQAGNELKFLMDGTDFTVVNTADNTELTVAEGSVTLVGGTSTSPTTDGAYGGIFGDFNGSRLVYNSFLAGVTKQQGIIITGPSMKVFDSNNSQGLINNDDYEANFVARSLATVQYIIARFAALAGGNTFTGAQVVQDGNFYVRLTGSNKYVYIDSSTINALNPDTGGAILLNGNSSTLQWNLGSLIHTLHADLPTVNCVWQMPTSSGTLLTDASPPFANKTSWASVATYAALTALGTPTSVTIVKVDADERVGLTNSIYQLWPDGSIIWETAIKIN